MKIKVFGASVMLAVATTATAGGILTNTNQTIDFLRNPARDAAIGIDGVYSNPAGVAFLPEGLHINLNWQYAHQTRTVESTNPFFALGHKNNGNVTKTFEGVATAPFIPSVQVAYNKGDWSWQFNFSIPSGGGKCKFNDGLGSFESVVGSIANSFMMLDGLANKLNGVTSQMSPIYQMMGLTTPTAINTHGVTGYDMDGYMEGRQYYFGFQLGTAYKINKDLSVYGGLRLLYGTANYKAKISNIMVGTANNGFIDFATFLTNVPVLAQQSASTAQQHIAIIDQMEKSGAPVPEALQQAKQQLSAGLETLQQSSGQLSSLAKYAEGVNLLCDQSSLGLAPVIGVDYRLGSFNFAAKYEFRTQIRMKNKSALNEASEIPAINKFRDGEQVSEDNPAQLAVGAMWSPSDVVRINAGWHHYFDKSAEWYNNTQELLDHDSNEYLAGVEWDLNDKLTISGGMQLTRYGLTDDYMNDMSFVVDSYSFGLGFNYKASDKVTLKAGYFQTNYEHYKKTTSVEPLVKDDFTRTNRVLGIGCELSL